MAAEGLGRLAGQRVPAPAADVGTLPRVVVLGFDGVDPRILSEYVAAGDMPNCAALIGRGGLHPLQSEIPPESPVAWASLLTGVNPGRHGILDFVVREPRAASGYQPVNGMVELVPPRFLFGRVPVRGPRVTSRLSYPTFLERVHEAGYPVLALRQPLAFPARDLPGSRVLTGLGTPDLAGSSSLYAVYSTRPDLGAATTVFGGHRIHLEGDPAQGAFETYLEGPYDRTKPAGDGGFDRVTVPLAIERRGPDGPVVVRVAGQEDAIAVGERGRWLRVPFTIPSWPPRTVHGRVRFFVREANPLTVLSSPVQIDPLDPALPISSPEDYAAYLERQYGAFKTAGWMEETFQLNDRNLSEEAFLKDLLEDMDSGTGILLGELRRGGRCVFYVFTQTDRAAHCFFRLRDKGHPAHDPALAARLGDPLGDVYRRMDRIVGEVAATLSPEDLLLVVSDHGFQTWRRSMNVNQWLLLERYLVLKDDPGERNLNDFFGGRLAIDMIDWSKTRAYALGLGQIYVNRRGREPQGIVEEKDVDALVAEIRDRLLAFRDHGAGGKAPIAKVYELHRIYRGPKVAETAEIQLAFAEGYRISWQTALLGGMGRAVDVCVNNLYPWSGDHCSTDRDLVPGILLSNHPVPPAPADRPYGVRDVAATVLRHFHLDVSDLDATPIPVGR